MNVSSTDQGYRASKDRVFAALAAVLFSSLSTIRIEIVGSLPLSELFAVLALPFLGVPKLLKKYSDLNRALLALCFILIGLVISDIINESPSENYLRGWAGTVISGVTLIFFLAIFDKYPGSIVWLLGTSILSALLGMEDFRLDTYLENPNVIKMGLSGIIVAALGIFTILTFQRKAVIQILLLVSGMILTIFNARSDGLILVVAGLLSLRRWKIRLDSKNLFYGFFFFTFLYVTYTIFIWSVLKFNLGGNTLAQLQLVQNPYNPLELIFVGRVDFFVTLNAIFDRPFVGWGSWGEDPNGRYYFLARDLLGISAVATADSGSSSIRGHSVILTPWLWGGIIGAFGSFIYGLLVLKSVNAALAIQTKYRFMALILLSSALWHLFFSPIGHLRYTIPLALAFVWTFTNTVRNREY